MEKHVGAERVKIRSDYRLTVRQIADTFEAREDRMMRYKDLVLQVLASFTAFEIIQVPREENLDADMLSKLYQTAQNYLTHLAKVQKIRSTSIDAIQVNAIDNNHDEWMNDMFKFHINGEALS